VAKNRGSDDLIRKQPRGWCVGREFDRPFRADTGRLYGLRHGPTPAAGGDRGCGPRGGVSGEMFLFPGVGKQIEK
jgi:hypothetical protein